jgi:hypothetical protein
MPRTLESIALSGAGLDLAVSGAPSAGITLPSCHRIGVGGRVTGVRPQANGHKLFKLLIYNNKKIHPSY